jgi:hypothetical protein
MLSNKIPILNIEETSNLVKILNTKYASYLRGRFFEIQANAERSIVSTTVLLKNRSESFYYPIEGNIDSKEENMTLKDAALFLIDYIDFYLEEFFKEDEGLYVTIEWSKQNFEEKTFFLKGQILNLERERLADQLLKREI